MDVNKIIDEILSKIHVNEYKSGVADSSSGYKAEKIIRRASEMVRKDYGKSDKIKEMQKIRPQRFNFSYNYNYIDQEKQFYQQGMFMADYEDDYDFQGEFYQYYPRYASMTFPQLRGYFKWRTDFRRGIYEKAEISFAYLYAYELLNNIGVSSPEEGFHKLAELKKIYSELDEDASYYLAKNIDMWLIHYAVYYALDLNLIKNRLEKAYEYIFVLQNIKDAAEQNDEERFLHNFVYFSSYNLLNSKFYKTYPNETAQALFSVYKNFCEYYDKYRKADFFIRLFGKKVNDPVNLFENAVFYKRKVDTPEQIYINDFLCYRKYKNLWTCDIYAKRNINKKLITEIIKNTEFYMREYYDFNYKIKPPVMAKINDEIINKTVLDFCVEHNLLNFFTLNKKKKKSKQEEKQEFKPIEVKIDISKFDKIRKDSIEIQKKLVIDDDEDFENVKESENICNVQNDNEKNAVNDALFDSTEAEIISAVLNGEKERLGVIAKENNIMLSIAIEKINEKFIELIGDNAIETIGDGYAVIEDYIEDVRNITGG